MLSAFDLLGQLQPAFFGGFLVGADLFECGHDRGEPGRVAGVEVGVGELRFAAGDGGVVFGDALGQRVVVALVLVGELALFRRRRGWRGGLGIGGGCRSTTACPPPRAWEDLRCFSQSA